MQEWMRWEPTKKRHPLASLELTPPRVVVGIGAAMAVLAGFMPWAEGMAPELGGIEPVFFSGLAGAGDGFILIMLSGAVGFLTLHHTPATSRVRTVHVLPVVLVVMAALTWVNGHRLATQEVDAWIRRGGSGGPAPGLWLALAGIGLMAVGLLPLLPGVVRWRRVAGDPSDTVVFTPRDLAMVVAGIAGCFVGGAIGISLTVPVATPPIIGLIALGAVFGALFGAYAGAWLVRFVEEEWRARGR